MVIIYNSNKVDKNREIIVASGGGFCCGVELAVQRVFDVLRNRRNGRIFLDGELVQNREISDRLRARGALLLDENSEICPEDTIVIRAHGVSPQRRYYLDNLGCKIVDCTCPLIGRITKVVEDYIGHPVILLGDRDHAEVKGVCGYYKNIHVCENLDELARVIDAAQQKKEQVSENISRDEYFARIMNTWVLVCQSTLDVDFFEAAKQLCAQKNFSIEIFDTICTATKQRQLGLLELKDCDAVIVVGGKHSANTKRLYEKMKQKIMAVFWVEDRKDLAEIDLSPYSKIGIAAGASTPQDALQDVYDEVSKKIA
jgi:4-hydroxy-3-methylbut-2-enyl diphosphate reductase